MRNTKRLIEDNSENNNNNVQKNLQLWNTFADALVKQINDYKTSVVAKKVGGRNRNNPTGYSVIIKDEEAVFESIATIKFDVASEAFELDVKNDHPSKGDKYNDKGTGFNEMLEAFDDMFIDKLIWFGPGKGEIYSDFDALKYKSTVTESFAEEFKLYESLWS